MTATLEEIRTQIVRDFSAHQESRVAVAPALLVPRDYQVECLDEIRRAMWGGMRAPAVVLPTGAGKSVVIGQLAAAWCRENPGRRALVIAHRIELVEQNAAKTRMAAPGLTVGIVKAERNQCAADVVHASVQTLASARRRKMIRDVGLLVVDEAHHAVAQTYLDVASHYAAPMVGFTATMSRGDKSALGKVWDDVVYTRSIADMIRDGWLVRPHAVRVRIDDLDMSKVRMIGGDYRESDLGAAMEDSMAPNAIARAYVEHAGDRSGLVFTPTVAVAELVAAELVGAGVRTAVLSGKTPTAERAAILAAYSAGVERNGIQVIVNCAVLTEGTDLPRTSCIVVARPTTSSGLYIQIVGRGLRTWAEGGKTDCLVIDVVGATARHALACPVELYGEDQVAILDREDEQEGEDVEEEVVESGPLPVRDDWRDGPLVSEEVDLFGGSRMAWSRTHGGTWFLPAGERLLAVLAGRAPGVLDVVEMHRHRRGDSAWIIRDIAKLAEAMMWAEANITPKEQAILRRDRPWRKKPISPAQRGLCANLGIAIDPRMSAGEVGDLISVRMASDRIDPHVPARATA